MYTYFTPANITFVIEISSQLNKKRFHQTKKTIVRNILIHYFREIVRIPLISDFVGISFDVPRKVSKDKIAKHRSFPCKRP